MTTAARPTWAPAKGGNEQGGTRIFGPSQKYSSRDIAAHTTLKPRFILYAFLIAKRFLSQFSFINNFRALFCCYYGKFIESPCSSCFISHSVGDDIFLARAVLCVYLVSSFIALIERSYGISCKSEGFITCLCKTDSIASFSWMKNDNFFASAFLLWEMSFTCLLSFTSEIDRLSVVFYIGHTQFSVLYYLDSLMPMLSE